MKVIHTADADSPGYTKVYLDEPIGTAQSGVVGTSDALKGEDGSDFEITLHGQQSFDLPNEVKALEFGDGTTLDLGGQ